MLAIVGAKLTLPRKQVCYRITGMFCIFVLADLAFFTSFLLIDLTVSVRKKSASIVIAQSSSHCSS